MRKTQRGFRLGDEEIKKLDAFCEKTGQSYNFVIEQCIAVGFPIICESAYYDAVVNHGITREDIAKIAADALVVAVEEKKRKKK